MIISKTAFMFLVVMVLVSVFFANFAYQIDFHIGPGENVNFNTVRYNPFNNRNDSIPNDSPNELFWFMQVSDIHISIFHDSSRVTELAEFCCSTVDIIQPQVVLASGDLTDAKHKNNMGSSQYKEEWQSYANTLKQCNITEKTLWLDIRGNHDNFNVPGWKSNLNYFRNYSIQGAKNPRSYMRIINKGGINYAFIALDACLEPGPRRPFNFMGLVTKKEVDEIKSFLKQANEMKVDHLIWFGHYPTSCILTLGDDSLRKLIGDVPNSIAYLCGHLHQMGGFVTEMYTLQHQGFLELELGDWKDNRMFRLAAIDHGLFSFVDVHHGKWPVILITNPKHALFVMPAREPLLGMRESSYIRLLAFSISKIFSVEAKIDDGKWVECRHVEGPLYVLKWDPNMYSLDVHTVYAKVRDVQGRENIVEQIFSLDGTRMNFKIFAKIILMLDAVRIFQCMFGTMLMACVLPLVILRFIHKRTLAGKNMAPRLKRNIIHTWIRKLWILSTVNEVYYPLLIYEFYLTVGPWSIGEILEGYMGAIFAWGVFVNGVFIPGSFTYAYGFIQMFLCQFPLTLILANSVDERYQQHWSGKYVQRRLFYRVMVHIPFAFILSIQMVLAYFFWLAYGTIAFLIGPLRTWSIILNIYLWYTAVSLPRKATREAAKVWSPQISHSSD